MATNPMLGPIFLTILAIACAAGGIWLAALRSVARQVIPFGGGLLMGVAAFWVLPEMAEFLRWPVAIAWIVIGYGILWLVNKNLYPVCPSCSHPHDHEHCTSSLHGFAAPLLLATALHAALDGWSVAASDESALHLSGPFLLAIGVHKIPEGFAIGVIAQAAMSSRKSALVWCALAEGGTLLGAALEQAVAPHLSPYFLHAILAAAGGTFLYLGWHAVHGEWRRKGGAAFLPAITGVASPSVLRLLRIFG